MVAAPHPYWQAVVQHQSDPDPYDLSHTQLTICHSHQRQLLGNQDLRVLLTPNVQVSAIEHHKFGRFHQ